MSNRTISEKEDKEDSSEGEEDADHQAGLDVVEVGENERVGEEDGVVEEGLRRRSDRGGASVRFRWVRNSTCQTSRSGVNRRDRKRNVANSSSGR